jgi:2',3'-cyclic-nucleotide 2'-phosphodiesterase/3'-nucleotidase
MEISMIKLASACLAVLCFASTTMAQTKNIEIKIIETSDVHGHFFPYDFIERHPLKGTLARTSSYIKRMRAQYGSNLLLLDNGDILQGQPTCYYSNYVKPEEDNVAARVVNYLKYDAQAIGNHDIETGHAVYDKWISQLKCPVLGANIINRATGQPYTSAYAIYERDGIRIAVLGMLTPAIPYWLNESLWSGMQFESIEKSAPRWIEHIRRHEKPDIIVGLFHSGWNGGISTQHYNEDETEKTATNIDGLDIIFFGHDHTQRQATVKNAAGHDVVCLNPSANALMVAEATIQLALDGKGHIKSKTVRGEIRNISDEPVDTDFIEHFKPAIDSVKTYVERRIGTMQTAIYTRDCFFGSAPFTDFIHNLQLQITGADISFNAPLSFNTGIEKGDIRMSDMFKLYRYENQIYVLNMTGEEVRRHLEMSYGQWTNTMTTANDHIMLLNNEAKNDLQRYGFKHLTFNFDSAAGIEYEVDVTKPYGQKVNITKMADGNPFDEKKWYKVVMNSYRGNGGGELLTRGAGIPQDSLKNRIVYQSEKDQRYYLTKEIERMGTVNPKANNNWRFVPQDWALPALERDRRLIFGNE